MENVFIHEKLSLLLCCFECPYFMLGNESALTIYAKACELKQIIAA